MAGLTALLVVNVGSTSLKLSVLAPDDSLLDHRDLATWDGDLGPLQDLQSGHPDVGAVVHRVVHGGPDFTGPVVVDDDVRRRLAGLTSLAPLHQPRALAGIDAVRRVHPDLPAVACFDTAFHTSLPASASTYPLPRRWREAWPIRRYGFHGLSHAYAARRTADLVGQPIAQLRSVTAHLGAGASLCAVEAGRSVDTTMGFTPLEGLVMATRSGSIDPGLVLWLLQHSGATRDEVAAALEGESGLLGLSDRTSDMAELERLVRSRHPGALLAVDVYVHRLVAGIAAMAAALGGLDALAFTGGVGEHSPYIRGRVADRLGFLGVFVDSSLDDPSVGDRVVSPPTAPVATVVLRAREDLEMAREARSLLGHE